MPAWIEKKGLSEYWERAKKQAAKQGMEGNYGYIMQIFKQMTKNKSLDPIDDGKDGREDLVKKSLFIPHSERFYRVPGQPPTRERIAALTLQKEAEKRPQGVTMARLMDGGRPMLSPQAIINGLGFDVVKSRNWGQFLEEAVTSANNELVLRKQVMDKAINEGMDSTLRRVILQRSLKHWRGLQKGVVQVVTPEELLEKAFTPGGNYHKRVPRKSGKGYNYYYDEDSYKRSKGRHVSGEEAGNEYIGTQIQKAVEEAGDGGCDIGTFEALVKKYGAKRVAGVMKEGGKYSFKKGKLFARKDEENVKKVKLELAQKPVKPPKAMKEEPKKVVRTPMKKGEGGLIRESDLRRRYELHMKEKSA